MTLRKNLLAAACTFGLIGLQATSAWADTCAVKDIRPLPDSVAVFVEQVRLALRASLRGKGEGWVLTEVAAGGATIPKTYCATGGQAPLAITVKAYFVGTVAIDDGKKAMGVIDLRRLDREEIAKIPPPENIVAELDRIAAERAALELEYKDMPNNRYAPGYNERQEKRYALTLKREKALKPHQDDLRQKTEENDKKFNPDIDRMQYEPRGTVELTANGWDVQTQPWLLIGGKGRTGPTTTRVVRIAAEVSGSSQPEQQQRWQAMVSAGLDKALLQAMVDGKIPSLAESNTVIAQQAEDMKTGMALKRETDKTRQAEESKARAALQAARAPTKTTPAAVATPAPSAPAAASTPAVAAAPVATPVRVVNPAPLNAPVAAPAPPAPTQTTDPAPSATPNINPAAILDGVNRLKGLFGR